jgi:retron-type reverse transcriptase
LALSLTHPAKVRKLQDALHSKAKNAPPYRFYALYDKLYRDNILLFPYDRCKANGGSVAVDGQTFADVEAYGLKRWLDELTQQLREGTYQSQPVRRVFMPKGDGKQRPLGIP